MAAKKRGLGRGLDALLSGRLSARWKHRRCKPIACAAALPLDRCSPASTSRARDMDRRRSPSWRSRSAQGVMQPILVRPLAAAAYEIIAGERRWRAASRLAWKPCRCWCAMFPTKPRSPWR